MSKNTTIKVRAGDGLRIPLPADVAVGTMTKLIDDSASVEVRLCSWTRRRLRCGDIVENAPAKKPERRPRTLSNATKTEG